MKLITEKKWYKLSFEERDDFTGIIKYNDGAISYLKNGIQHRDDGPAYTDSDIEEYYLDGILHTKETFDLKKFSKEIIICSAIKLPNGMIFRGHRHSDCIRTAHEFITWNGGIDPGEHHWNSSMSRDQGFITSRNRFVSRSEAMKLQLDAGIPSVVKGGYRGTVLYSEDLY